MKHIARALAAVITAAIIGAIGWLVFHPDYIAGILVLGFLGFFTWIIYTVTLDHVRSWIR
jgi:hypothetical protein